ncbi:MAG TPA: type II toxin-antitoxin system HigB family toxin [Stellaceae bacterium]|nr:type II toxin-antitoxin system HigB family toxin [Stellaceae bacterium]
MQVVALRTLKLFWAKHPQAERPLRTWYSLVSQAEWTGPADVRAQFGSADFVADNRVIFDIGGNKFRLVVHVSYDYKAVLVKFVGTHAEYDEIDPVTYSLT